MSNESARALMAQIPATSTPPPQAPTSQPPAPPEAAAPTSQEPTELKSTVLAKRVKEEKERFRSLEAFKAEKAQFEAERERLVAAEKRLTEFNQLKEKDAIAAMKFAGFTDTDILNYFATLEDKSTPEDRAARAAQTEIKKFQDEMAAKERAQFEAKINEDVTYFKTATQRELLANKEKYEYCNYHGPLAEQLIEATAAEVILAEGAPQSKEEFAKLAEEITAMVENYYEEQDKAMGTIKKRTPAEAKAHAIEQIAELKAEVSPGQPGKSPTKTLSNRAVTATTAAAMTNRRESSTEKRQRLESMLRNMGKKD